MPSCPCQSGLAYASCCEPYILQVNKPDTAEQLMRARYTAHTVANIDYIVKTHHPVSRSDIDAASTAKWARESDWLGLEIRSVEGGQAKDRRARVEFMASYRDSNGQRRGHHEIALFDKHNGDWYFRDAEVPKVSQFRHEVPKQGRNELCSCGSGKKFKKCCGAA